jgi:lipoyl(octanoyl) transferase
MNAEIWCVRCGQVPYEEARQAQRRIAAARQAGQVPDVLLLLEHPPVYTKGRRTEPGELGMGEDWYRMQGIDVCETDRGGRVTYHGPGQLVGYPIVSLKPYGDDVRAYVRRLERLMIESLAGYAVPAAVIEGLTGVWAGPGVPEEGSTAEDVTEEVVTGTLRKIGSIGVHVSRGVTTHGFAVNVNNDLQPFEWVVPCGIEGCRMTSICRELGAAQDMGAYMDVVTDRFGEIYEREPASMEASALAEGVEGLDALVAAGPAARHLSGNGAPASVR